MKLTIVGSYFRNVAIVTLLYLKHSEKLEISFLKNTSERQLLQLSITEALKVQSCKLFNCKYMIASTQITNTEIFTFIAVLVFKLLSRKVLFIKRKDNRNC